MGTDTASIFIVRVPECDVEALRRMRDFVAESLVNGIVLVLPTDATLETIQVPNLCGVAVGGLMEPLKITLSQPGPDEPAAENADEEPPKTTSVAAAEEKQAIIHRLKEFRDTNGLGCLSKVAKATRSRGAITDDTLRAIVSGSPPKMELSDWRKIGRALERLEQSRQNQN